MNSNLTVIALGPQCPPDPVSTFRSAVLHRLGQERRVLALRQPRANLARDPALVSQRRQAQHQQQHRRRWWVNVQR